MFDVFYKGPKPNLFAHEYPADNVSDAMYFSRTKFFWYIYGNNDYSDFDFDWVPDKWEDQQYHIFPDQWCRNSGTYFINKHCAEDRVLNYRSEQTIKSTGTRDRWFVPEGVKIDSVDFSWHPDPMDTPYIYHFPTKYYKSSGVTYTAPGATEIKLVSPFVIKFESSTENWNVPEDVNTDSIDFTWRPDAMNPAYIYHFPTKFNKASAVTYTVPGGTVYSFVRPFYITHLINKSNWSIPDGMDETSIDFTWRPDPLEPPYIYKFPSKWARDAGLEYHVPGATTPKFVSDKYGKFVYDITASFNADALPRYFIETTIEDLIDQHKDEIFWALNKEMNYDDFDFSWHPDNSQRDYVHVFGNQWSKHAQTFYIDAPSISGKYRFNFVGSQTVRATSSTHIFYVDKSNSGSAARYEILSASHENISTIRYVKDMFSTCQRASQKSKGHNFWLVSSDNDYTDFDFSWQAEPWQDYMLHIFGSAEQKWSDTYLVNKNTFDHHATWCKDLKDMPDLNFVEDQQVKAINVNDIYEVDFGQHETLQTVQHETLKTTRFVDSYLAVIKRIVSQSISEYIWVVSNICDYSNFNFDWRPEPYQAKMLHVFGPGNNKFGDTFLVHVPTFREQMDKLELLDWFKTVNYNNEQIVPRLPYDMVSYNSDDLTAIIKSHKFNSPYALFFPEGQDVSKIDYNPSVWRLKDRAIHTFTDSGSVVLAPRDSLQYLDTQCYDYPEITRQKTQFQSEKPLDIVYISNGEPTAELMYDHLMDITKDDKSLVVKRVEGVKGRAAAYKAAAEASDTDWAFNVFAKLEMDPDFDWHWQPDRLQEPKHYIFHAKNPVNGLVYGHQACIAYNKKLVLETNEWGLDFTLSREHEVIPVLSGVARYNSDPFTTWRTAFREALKLLANPTEENQARLKAWFSGNEGEYGDMSIQGTTDAYNYFTSVNGDHERLLLSFEWKWLREYYLKLQACQTPSR